MRQKRSIDRLLDAHDPEWPPISDRTFKLLVAASLVLAVILCVLILVL